MNWRLFGLLAWLGPCVGGLTVLGVFPRGVDRFVWAAVVVVCAWVVARREPARALKNAAVLGFWNGASSTMVQAVFVRRLVANNPWFLSAFAHEPAGFDLEFFVYMLVPFIGVAGGAMTGLLSMVMARALAARRRPPRGGETAP